jgi:hypothetical protein
MNSLLVKALTISCGLTALLGVVRATASPVVLPTQSNPTDVPTIPLHTAPHPASYTNNFDYHAFSLCNGLNAAEDIRVYMTYNALDRKVSMKYSFHEGLRSNRKSVTEVVQYPTSYYPTCAIYLGNNKVAVAGKDVLSGKTLIEVWVLNAPNLIRVPGAGGNPEVWFLRPSRVTDIATSFSPDPASNFGVVRAMWRNRALGGEHILALSYAKRDMFAIDLSVGTAVAVIEDTAPVGALPAEPALATDWASYRGPYRHTERGDLYTLTNLGDVAAEGPTVHSLYMWDANLDGIPDSTELMSADTEEVQGLDDQTKWTFSH